MRVGGSSVANRWAGASSAFPPPVAHRARRYVTTRGRGRSRRIRVPVPPCWTPWLDQPISSGAPSVTRRRGCSTASGSRGGRKPSCSRQLAAEQVPDLITPRRFPPGSSRAGRRRPADACRGAVAVAAQAGPGRRSRRRRRPLAPSAAGCRAARADVHQARPDHLLGRGAVPPELVEEFKRCRDQVPAEPFDVVRGHRRDRARAGRWRRCSRRSTGPRSPPRRSPRSTPPACTPARTSSSRCSGPPSGASCTPTCGRWRGSRRTSSDGSPSPRWPTRRRSSSCSPTRSSRSSTSASRPPTCSTWPRCCTTWARTATSCPARTPSW